MLGVWYYLIHIIDILLLYVGLKRIEGRLDFNFLFFYYFILSLRTLSLTIVPLFPQQQDCGGGRSPGSGNNNGALDNMRGIQHSLNDIIREHHHQQQQQQHDPTKGKNAAERVSVTLYPGYITAGVNRVQPFLSHARRQPRPAISKPCAAATATSHF